MNLSVRLPSDNSLKFLRHVVRYIISESAYTITPIKLVNHVYESILNLITLHT